MSSISNPWLSAKLPLCCRCRNVNISNCPLLNRARRGESTRPPNENSLSNTELNDSPVFRDRHVDMIQRFQVVRYVCQVTVKFLLCVVPAVNVVVWLTNQPKSKESGIDWNSHYQQQQQQSFIMCTCVFLPKLLVLVVWICQYYKKYWQYQYKYIGLFSNSIAILWRYWNRYWQYWSIAIKYCNINNPALTRI